MQKTLFHLFFYILFFSNSLYGAEAFLVQRDLLMQQNTCETIAPGVLCPDCSMLFIIPKGPEKVIKDMRRHRKEKHGVYDTQSSDCSFVIFSICYTGGQYSITRSNGQVVSGTNISTVMRLLNDKNSRAHEQDVVMPVFTLIEPDQAKEIRQQMDLLFDGVRT